MALAFPIIGGQVSQMLLGLADTLMIGRLGTVELAAAALVNVLFYFPFVLAIGWFAAVSVQISHAHGGDRHAEAAESFRNGLLVSGIMGLVLAASLFVILPFLPYLRQPPEVTAMTPPYLAWVALSLITLVPAMTIKSFAEAKNHPWAVLWIMLAGVALNVLLNYILIFGNLGAPALGLAGAGLATFIARALTLVGLWYYLKHSKRLAPSRPTRWLAPLNWRECRSTLKIACPISGQLSLEFGAFAVAALLIGQFGPVALASHQIAITCASFTFMLPLGLAMAVTIRVAHSLGKGSGAQCRNILIGAHGTTLLMMSVCALVFILGGDQIAAAFTTDPAVITLTGSLLIVVALFQVFDGTQIISMSALRGMRDVNRPTGIIFFCFWVIGIPLGAALGFPGQMGALGLWIGLAIGLAFAALILSLRLSGKLRTLPRKEA